MSGTFPSLLPCVRPPFMSLTSRFSLSSSSPFVLFFSAGFLSYRNTSSQPKPNVKPGSTTKTILEEERSSRSPLLRTRIFLEGSQRRMRRRRLRREWLRSLVEEIHCGSTSLSSARELRVLKEVEADSTRLSFLAFADHPTLPNPQQLPPPLQPQHPQHLHLQQHQLRNTLNSRSRLSSIWE